MEDLGTFTWSFRGTVYSEAIGLWKRFLVRWIPEHVLFSKFIFSWPRNFYRQQLDGPKCGYFWHFFSIYDQNVSKYGVIMSRTQIKSLWTVCLAKFDRRKVSLFFSYLQNIGLISRNEDILYRLFWVFSRTYDYISKSCIEYLYYPKYFSMRKIFLVCLAYLESRIFYHQHLLIFWHIWNLEIAPIK